MKKYLVSAIIFLSIFNNIYSQKSVTKKTDWLSYGVGIGQNKTISSFVSYTYAEEDIYQFSINGNQEFSILRNSDPDYVVSATLAYGKRTDWSFIFGGVFVGPSFVIGKKRREEIKHTIGININSQILFSPSDVLGVGFDFFGNLNFYESIYGARMVIFFKAIK